MGIKKGSLTTQPFKIGIQQYCVQLINQNIDKAFVFVSNY